MYSTECTRLRERWYTQETWYTCAVEKEHLLFAYQEFIKLYKTDFNLNCQSAPVKTSEGWAFWCRQGPSSFEDGLAFEKDPVTTPDRRNRHSSVDKSRKSSYQCCRISGATKAWNIVYTSYRRFKHQNLLKRETPCPKKNWGCHQWCAHTIWMQDKCIDGGQSSIKHGRNCGLSSFFCA